MRALFIRMLVILFAVPCNVMAEPVQDSLLSILNDVISNKYEKFHNDSVPANFVGIRVYDRKYAKLKSVLGISENKENSRKQVYGIDIKIGSRQSLNYQYGFVRKFDAVKFTNDDNSLQTSISEELEKYFSFLKKGRKGFSKDTLGNVISLNDVSYYSGPLPEKYYEEPLDNDDLDTTKWQSLLNEVTNKYRTEKNVIDASASLTCEMLRRYLVTSDGGEIVDNDRNYEICLSLKISKSEGQNKILNKWYRAKCLNELPTKKMMMKDADEMLRILNGLCVAPEFESYEGPILLGGKAACVLMHEIIGHHLESGYRGGVFKTIGTQIFPDFVQITDDPTTVDYRGISLMGHYKYDDEGIPAQAVTCINNGVLQSMLTCRTPFYAGSVSNGHGRGVFNGDANARQSNFFVSTSKPVSESRIRKMFVKELKRQNLEYGIYIPELEGGSNGWDSANSLLWKTLNKTLSLYGDFYVQFSYAYKVYADGRPDELVNGAQVYSFREAVYKAITAMGAESEVFNGICSSSSSSGSVPVSLIAPKTLFKCVKFSLKPKKVKSQ